MNGYAVTVSYASFFDGETHPNEDRFYVNAVVGDDSDVGVAAVFDGLAGHGGGAQASTVAWDAIAAFTAENPVRPRWVSDACEFARQQLNSGRSAPDAKHPQMTCTAVVARVDGGQLDLAWCGDSRAYLRTAQGTLMRLTYDHDLIFDQVVRSRVQSDYAETARAAVAEASTASEAYRLGGPLAKKAFKKKHVMFSDLSSGPISVRSVPFPAGSMLVLTTDGVHDNLTMTQMRAVAAASGDPRSLAQTLVEQASEVARTGEGRGHPDDITCVTLAG
jgi:serine/threonine protein phosphatase PrpC